MFTPAQIIEKVQKGHLPQNWHVFHDRSNVRAPSLFFFRRRPKTQPATSFLVVTPEGVVVCLDCSDAAQRNYRTLDFARIHDLYLHARTSDLHLGQEATDVPTITTSFWFDVTYLDGTLERWPLDQTYGNPETIAQYIIEARTLYTVQSH